MYQQYFQNMPDDELAKAITAFTQYADKYKLRRDTDGERRMRKLIEMAKNEVSRRQKESSPY
tara:strand:+ start:385 stop:570 length:186 start_codon:yes stop_codon:yes gene_type:complete